jgi:hypothetical protein
VFTNGRLSPNFGFGPHGTQRQLLEAEGVTFTNSRVEKKHFYARNTASGLSDATVEKTFEVYNRINGDTSHYMTTDDICTPMECVKRMIDYIPNEFWQRGNIKVLDPCCGNGNFGAYCKFKTSHDNIWYNDLNKKRIANLKMLLSPKNITQENALLLNEQQWDLIMANPPYSGGGNKNQSLSNLFIEHSISILNDKGYLCFVVPNNWMTFNNNNTTLKKLLKYGSFIVIDNDIKKYFPSVGSSFSVFVWQKGVFDNKTTVVNSYLVKDIQHDIKIPNDIPLIPLYVSKDIISLVMKTMNGENSRFNYRCDLHNFTQNKKLNDTQNDIFKYETIHTARKTRYAKIKQDIYDKWNIIIPLSTYYVPYIRNNVNVTQSVGYISFDTKTDAENYLKLLTKPEFKVLVHLSRYGNFNNIMLLKHLAYEKQIDFTESELQEIKKLACLIKY